MDRYFARATVESSEKRARIDSNMASDDVVSDPALRKSINDYEPRIRDDIRRKYVQMGPCRPTTIIFPRSQCGDRMRCFQAEWFNKWEWLEYSISEQAAFCFWCYLFGEKRAGDQAFTKNGFRNWKKATEKFRDHVGNEGSIHNNAKTLYLGFKDQRQSVTRKLRMGNEVLGAAYRMRLTASLDVARLLLGLGLAFRGNDESAMSIRRGNFLEILTWYSLRNVDVRNVIKENAPANHQLTSPDIQKQIISACASETTKAIISDIGDKYFALLLDEARDNSIKEQMAVVIRYANNSGEVLERFVGVVHVKDTTAVSLKSAIDDFFSKHGLSMSKVRGQGYDGASNMRGELNGLKTLILNENPYARYVHCFAHQLQLVVVAVAEGNQFVSDFFDYMSFSESSTELLMCIACLDPKGSFSNFSLSKVLRLAELYPLEFSSSHLMELKEELKTWISEMRMNDTFSKLHNIGDLAKKMVEMGYNRIFPLVYLLIELILVLPVATATVERAFSAMNIIKSNLRNKMGDEFLTDCLVCYIEKDLFTAIDNEVILQHFQNMKTRRTDLPRLRVQ